MIFKEGHNAIVIRSLVTGVAGFIGSHLAERLIREGHQVCGVDRFKVMCAIHRQKSPAHERSSDSFLELLYRADWPKSGIGYAS